MNNKQYRLINRTTNEETICTKVCIEGFDYYVDNTKGGFEGLNYNYASNKLDKLPHSYKDYSFESKYCKKVIATNNPSFDVGQIIDELDYLIFRLNTPKNCDQFCYDKGFKEGYNTHAETHTLSDDEVVEFAGYFGKYYANIHNPVIDTKEILQLFKEQQIKTIYYE